MMKRLLLGVGAASLLMTLSSAAFAQETMPEGVLATGLNNPRHIVFSPEGTLYVAEAGTGGPFTVESMFGPAAAGGSAAVSSITDGVVTPITTSLPSVDAGGEVGGAHGLEYAADLLWIAIGGEPAAQSMAETVIAVDPTTNRIVHFIDTYAAEAEQNPDGGDVDSNPVDLRYDPNSGLLYIADAGCNCVWTWTEADGVQLFASWDSNPVPTSVEVAPDGSVWVGFLTGFPFPTGGSRVEQYSAEGELQETYEGFTAIVDLLFANDTVYAVSIGEFGEMGWTPGTGSVTDVLSGETYVDGLVLPYGLAMSPEMELVIVTSSAYAGPGTGTISSLDSAQAVSMEMMSQMGLSAAVPETDATAEMTDPMETPEAGS